MMNLYALHTQIGGKDTVMLTLLDAEALAEVKNQNAILGILKNADEPIVHHNIIYNPAFVQFFHKTMLVFAELAPAINASANHTFMYIVDERCNTPDNPEKHDIIGSFDVEHGMLVKESYQPNKNYQFISEKGLFKLPAQIERVLFMALV
jgi:hypothetical protein